MEVNGQVNPDTVVLRAGRRYRLRFIGLSVTSPNATVYLTARPDSSLTNLRDTMLVSWSPLAKDGADLPESERIVRPARQVVSIGETYDFEFFPREPAELRIEVRPISAGRLFVRVPVRVESARTERIAAQSPPSIQGAWRLVETAVRSPGGEWDPRPAPQGGLYVFSARHYSYFYVRGAGARSLFNDANRPTEAEMAAAYDSFIAGAGTYDFDGLTLRLKADFRKNPNEMNGQVWRLQTQLRGDTLRFEFDNPPFLPGRQWRTTLMRIE
jgi:hypothetical protein